MELTLTITSYQSHTLGPDAHRTFSELGGTIGRADGNHWVLPDPERYISGQHAAISYQDGVFFVTDTSTNGVYVNDAPMPLGNGKCAALHSGDRLSFGDYEFEVRIEAGAADSESSHPPMQPADYGFGRDFGVSSAPSQPSQPDSLNPLDFIAQPSGDSAGKPLTDPWVAGDEPGAESDHLPSLMESFQAPKAHAEEIPDDWDMTDYGGGASRSLNEAPGHAGGAMRPIPGPPARQSPAPASERGQVAGADAGMRSPQPAQVPGGMAAVSDAGEDLFSAFVRGAGLDPAGLKQSNNAETMESYGRLLRIVVEGMMEVLMARASLKSEFRVPLTTIRPVENNPLKFSPNADEALRILFMSRNGGYLPPEAAVAEGFEDVKSHQMAMVAGMQAAFNKMIVRFKPEAIQQLEEADGVRAALKSVNRKSRLWDAYCGFYREMTQDATASFQKLFGDEFARAYESQIQRLVKSRRE